MARDMPEPCKFPPLDSCRKRFLWTHKEVALDPHPVVGLLLQVGDVGTFPPTLVFESLDPLFFSESASRVHVSQPQREIEVARDLLQRELSCEVNGVAAPDHV